MRISDDYEEQFNNELWFLDYNREKALKGKKGRAALKELKDILAEMLDKRLESGYLQVDGIACLVGAYAKAKGFELPEAGNYWDTIKIGQLAGLSKPLTEYFILMNDDYWENYTPEERYTTAVKWVDLELVDDK